MLGKGKTLPTPIQVPHSNPRSSSNVVSEPTQLGTICRKHIFLVNEQTINILNGGHLDKSKI